MNNILITTECVADLPRPVYRDNEVKVIYYDIETEEGGIFRDTVEIDSHNVIEYMDGGHRKVYSVIPTANDYKNFFSKHLREYDEIVHICISGGISKAYENAKLARVKMGLNGNKVHIIDSRHLSCGQGLITLEAIACRNQGMKCKEIVEHLQEFMPRVCTTFLANNADYLYYNGKVKKSIMDFCRIFHLHPVLEMKEGILSLKKVYMGNYNKAASKYIKSLIGKKEDVDTKYGFLVYTGCSEDLLDLVRKEQRMYVSFENSYEIQASGTVSCNCGPQTFGIMFVRKEKP